MEISERFLDDKASRQELINRMPPALRAEYLNYRFTGKEAAFTGRVLVAYTLEKGRPTNVDLITLRHLTMERGEGPVTHASSGSQGEYPIGMVPTKWRGRDLFFQLPLEFIFRWRGKATNAGVNFGPVYAILIRTRSRVDEQIEGHSYCETLNDFRARFPADTVRY